MFQYTSLRSGSRRIWLTTAFTALALTGCIVGSSDDGDEAKLYDDRELAGQLLDGWLAPEDMYEVRDFKCFKGPELVEATMTIVNTNDFAWAFGVEAVFYTKDGEALASTTDPGFWEPGQAVELSEWTRPLDDFDDPPRCEVNIRHGVDLAFRNPENRAMTYERLGWDPENEERIDGS